MSNHLSDFHGHCALFSCGTFSEDDGHFEPHWSSCGFCAFSIIVGVYTLLSSVGQILAKVRRLYQVRDWYVFTTQVFRLHLKLIPITFC